MNEEIKLRQEYEKRERVHTEDIIKERMEMKQSFQQETEKHMKLVSELKEEHALKLAAIDEKVWLAYVVTQLAFWSILYIEG